MNQPLRTLIVEDSDYIVLDNLLSNAWKFTARRVTARIAFGAAPTDPSPSASVVEFGGGVKESCGRWFGAPRPRLGADNSGLWMMSASPGAITWARVQIMYAVGLGENQ
jgi:hypothetical protein